MMHGYIGFSDDVKNIFKGLSQEYNLQITSESPVEIIFKSDKCIIAVITEYNYTQVYFKQNEEDRWMVLGPFFKAVYPNNTISVLGPPEGMTKIEQIRFSLRQKVEMIKTYCLPILQGDFSWRVKYFD
jgi:hypothetical protein